jgi:uncharacterized membrane protein YbhN (UPF0104 family)
MLLVALVMYFSWGAARTLAFVVATVSLTELEAADASFIALAGALGGIAGQIVVLAPMGLGIREGVSAGILRQRSTTIDAASAVASTRIIQTVAELPAIALTEIVCLIGGRSDSPPGGPVARGEGTRRVGIVSPGERNRR